MRYQARAEVGSVAVLRPGTDAALAAELQELRLRLDAIAEQVCAQANNSPALLNQVRASLELRRWRNELFGSELFADPAWDMLLELFRMELEQQRISTSKLCTASGVPETTALRWISKLKAEGLIQRHHDQFDARRIWIELSAKGSQLMHRYFAEPTS